MVPNDGNNSDAATPASGENAYLDGRGSLGARGVGNVPRHNSQYPLLYAASRAGTLSASTPLGLYNRSIIGGESLGGGNGFEDHNRADRGSINSRAAQIQGPGRPCPGRGSHTAVAQRRIAT